MSQRAQRLAVSLSRFADRTIDVIVRCPRLSVGRVDRALLSG